MLAPATIPPDENFGSEKVYFFLAYLVIMFWVHDGLCEKYGSDPTMHESKTKSGDCMANQTKHFSRQLP
jgi:hypothetical protein